MCFNKISLLFYLLSYADTDKTLLHGDLGDPDQRLALNVIHDLCNSALELCKFVPEHVETRQLYNPIVPDIPQVCKYENNLVQEI